LERPSSIIQPGRNQNASLLKKAKRVKEKDIEDESKAVAPSRGEERWVRRGPSSFSVIYYSGEGRKGENALATKKKRCAFCRKKKKKQGVAQGKTLLV